MISQVFIKCKATSSTSKIYQLNTNYKVNLFNRRVPVIATIYWETHRNTSIHHDNIFSPYSGYLLFNTRACMITRKSRAPIRGKLHHRQTTKTCSTHKRRFSHRRNKPHAHHKTHLHTMKVVTILIPSVHGLR